MLKILNKIRIKLLFENKTSKYIKYSIGEIFLVVIGILLALQINNWNENRKLKIKELKSLKELRTDLNQNLNDIISNLGGLRQSHVSNMAIKQSIENKLTYNDSLNFHFSKMMPFIAFTINQTTYDNLKEVGLELISNDSLRLNISDLYGNQYALYRKFENQYLLPHYNQFIKPFQLLEFSSYSRNKLEPKNYKELMENEELNLIIDFSLDLYKTFILYQNNLLQSTEELINDVDIEIEYIEKLI